jgi:hypothetical protein
LSRRAANFSRRPTTSHRSQISPAWEAALQRFGESSRHRLLVPHVAGLRRRRRRAG